MENLSTYFIFCLEAVTLYVMIVVLDMFPKKI